MPDIPEDLLRRMAEAQAEVLGLPVEEVEARLREGRPLPEQAPVTAAAKPSSPVESVPVVSSEPPPAPPPAPTPAAEAPAAPVADSSGGLEDLLARAAAAGGLPESLVKRSAAAKAKAKGVSIEAVLAEMAGEAAPAAVAAAPAPAPAAEAPAEPKPVTTAQPADVPPPTGAGKAAAVVSPRPLAPPANTPDGVRTQRLLTVVKARAIQQVKKEPTDKVSTWPHLLLIEFVALLAMLALLLILSSALQAPLLDPANFNATPNPSKAPWYFLGLQELLSYFDPQIAGVIVPAIVGVAVFMMIPYVDRNPSTKPSDRKFAIMLYTFFLAGAATLTILGVLFRGKGFNFSYPWRDGIFFDDLKDWVHFE